MEEESWIKIRNELTIVWRNSRFKPIPKYQVWVELFSQLEDNNFAIFFAHVTYDKVPKSIFSKVKPISFGSNFHHQIYGINTTREVGSFEQFILDLIELGNINVKAKYVVILVILFGLGGFFLVLIYFPLFTIIVVRSIII